MPDESGWSNVSFTPHGQSTVRFGNVRVTFPSIDSLLEEYEELDREDLLSRSTKSSAHSACTEPKVRIPLVSSHFSPHRHIAMVRSAPSGSGYP